MCYNILKYLKWTIKETTLCVSLSKLRIPGSSLLAHASSWMNFLGGVSGAVYHYDEENIYVDFLTPNKTNVAGGPFCTGEFNHPIDQSIVYLIFNYTSVFVNIRAIAIQISNQ